MAVRDKLGVLQEIRDWLTANVTAEPDGEPAENTQAASITMPLTPGTVVSVTIPTDMSYMAITPATAIYFAIDADPVAIVSKSGASISGLGIGNVARSGETTRRRLPTGASTLRLISSGVSPLVDVEFYG